MRSKIVFGLLILMLGTLAVMLVMRPRDTQHEAPAIAAEPEASGGADAAEKGKAGGRGAAAAKKGKAGAGRRDASVAARADAGARGPLPRTLRVASMGWDVMAPGLLANGGTTTAPQSVYGQAHLVVSLSHASSLQNVERMLARGGEASDGADVAIVPLPTFAAAYERLRALQPCIFAVVAWSHGREALYGARTVSLAAPPSGEVKLVGGAGEPALFFASFLLERAGVAPARIRVVGERDSTAAAAPFAAVTRRGDEPPGDRRLLASTADASRLIPWVAIAPRAFLDAHPEATRELLKGWLAGGERLSSDVPAAARTVAGIRGAPEAVDLLRLLGQLELSTLADEARAAGLSGRGAVTIETLFAQSWKTWRALGVLTTPQPDAAPLHTAALIDLVRADSERAMQPAPGRRGDPVFTGPPLLVAPIPGRRPDERAFVESLGLLAGIFERSPIRLTSRARPADLEPLLQQAIDRYDLDRTRFQLSPRPAPSGPQTAIEILPAP